MTSVETNINSYDAGQKRYKNDPNRGKWESKWDFFFACVSHAFGIRNFGMLPLLTFFHGGLYCIPPFIIAILLFSAPIFLVQSFLGQFSSSGYISVFRIAPLFKGIGYFILALNFTSLTYISSVAGLTILHLYHFITLEKTWMKCDNSWNTPNCSETLDKNMTSDVVIPMTEFSDKVIMRVDPDNFYDISWPVMIASLLVWILVASCLLQGVEKIGKILRYSTMTISIILVILLIRVLCLPNVGDHLQEVIEASGEPKNMILTFILSPMLGGLTLGSGWGMVLTMSSYNRFKVDIEKFSYAIPFATAGFILISGLITYIVHQNLENQIGYKRLMFDEYSFAMLFFGFPYFFGKLEASQMWLVMLYLMLFLCEFNSVVLQAFSILTALKDEFEFFRNYTYHLIGGLCGTLFILSLPYAITHGFEICKMMYSFGNTCQMIICFLEVIMIIWIYGRLRFLRDIQFLLNRTFRPCKFYILRFVTPIYIFILGLFNAGMSEVSSVYTPVWLILLAFFIKATPLLCFPIYAIYKLSTITGTILERLRKSVKPTDWYPAEASDRQKYETALGTSDISQQLMEMEEEQT